MRHFKSLLCVVILCVTASVAVLAQDTNATRLVGFWREYGGGNDNLVDFRANGTVSLYLRKGEIGDQHTMEGEWTLSDDSTIKITFSMQGKTFSQTAKLSFDGDEMDLTDDKGVTRHRRHTGPLPDWTQW